MDGMHKEEPWISRILGRLLGVIVAFAMTPTIAAASVSFSHLGGQPTSASDSAGWVRLPPLSPQQP